MGISRIHIKNYKTIKIDNEDVSKKFDELLNEIHGEKYTKTITEI